MAAHLRIHGDVSPRADRTPVGYATVPRSATRRPDIRVEKVTLDALLGLCWGESRVCKSSLSEICAAAGIKSERTVRRHLARLIEVKLIARRPDPDNPGGPWLTYILADPKGFELGNEPLKNWRLVGACTPGQKCPDPRTDLTPPPDKSVRPLPYKQPSLPLGQPPDVRASLPEKTEPASTDPYRGPRNPGTPPLGYRWLYGQGNPKEGARPALVPAVPRPDPTDPEVKRGQEQLAREGLRSFFPAAEKKTGCGVPLESPPQPTGVQISQKPSRPYPKHTVQVCSGQETRSTEKNGQRARQDSNLQPSDSKSASSQAESRLNSSAENCQVSSPPHEESGKTRGFPIRGFSHVADLDTPSCPPSHPTGSQEDA